MEKQYYYYIDGQTKVGPISLDALKRLSITGNTLVWHESLTDWVEASTLPELSSLFVNQAPPLPPAPPSCAEAEKPTTTHIPPPMPDNYLVWAILSTICCCWPFGIASIIYSTKVNTLYATGDYDGAQEASKNAKKWAIVSAIVVGVLIILYFIFIMILFAIGVMGNSL